MTSFEKSHQLVLERWISMFNPMPLNAIDLYHGNPLVPPPKIIKSQLQSIANEIEYWSESNTLLTPRTINKGKRKNLLNLHYYRVPELITPELKKAAVKEFQKDGIPINFDRNEITVGVGVTQLSTALFYALTRSTKLKEKVLMPTPTYSAFWLSSELVKGKIEILDAARNEDYKITSELIEKGLIEHPDACAIFLVNPVNPTGEVIPRSELEEIARIINKHPDVTVIVDEIYKDMILDKNIEFTSFASLKVEGQRMFERTITLRGVSKCYGLAKLRIGIACCSEKMMKQLHLGSFLWLNTAAPSEIDQLTAAAAFEYTPSDYFTYITDVYREHRDLVIAQVNSINQKINDYLHTDGVIYVQANKPQSGFFILIKLSYFYGKSTPQGKCLKNDFDLSSYLVECGVAFLAGSVFGFDEKDMLLRVTFSSERKDLVKGLNILESALVKILKNENQST